MSPEIDGEPRLVSALLHAPFGFLARDVAQLQRKRDVLKHCHVRIEREILKHHRDRFATRRVRSANLNLATVRKFKPCNHPKQRSLSTSRRTEQNYEFSALHGQRNVKDASARRETARQFANHEVGHDSALSRTPRRQSSPQRRA